MAQHDESTRALWLPFFALEFEETSEDLSEQYQLKMKVYSQHLTVVGIPVVATTTAL